MSLSVVVRTHTTSSGRQGSGAELGVEGVEALVHLAHQVADLVGGLVDALLGLGVEALDRGVPLERAARRRRAGSAPARGRPRPPRSPPAPCAPSTAPTCRRGAAPSRPRRRGRAPRWPCRRSAANATAVGACSCERNTAIGGERVAVAQRFVELGHGLAHVERPVLHLEHEARLGAVGVVAVERDHLVADLRRAAIPTAWR